MKLVSTILTVIAKIVGGRPSFGILAILGGCLPFSVSAEDAYKAEVSAYTGVNSSFQGKHPLVGGTIGVALNRNVQLFFEPSYAASGDLAACV
jgi:hypothetical protein